mgnify:FL=1
MLHEYPNWRVPLADDSGQRVWIEDLAADAASDSDEGVFATMRDEFGRKKRGVLKAK